MEQNEVFNQVSAIFRRVISDTIEPRLSTSSREVQKWDSLSHVMFIAEVEKTFGIRFDILDMLDMRTIGDICNGVREQLKLK